MGNILRQIFKKPPIMPPSTQSYSTRTAAKIGKMYSNDGKDKNHTHMLKETCTIPGCSGKLCIGLCGKRVSTEVLGNNTHKPPKGSDNKKISEYDANGDKKEQWYVKNNQRREISEKERIENNKEITSYPKHNIRS